MSFAQAVTILDTIAGGNQRGGELLVSEWGVDMGRFGMAARLAARSSVAPGHEVSTGNQALRTGLTPLAHAVARTKGTYLSALY
jgi:hypothetical protein